METLGERLYYARKSRRYTQSSLADAIGISRGVIFNLEKNKTTPQTIVINAICQTLNINKEWLLEGTGNMTDKSKVSSSILAELYEIAENLPQEDQFFLLRAAIDLKQQRLDCNNTERGIYL